jgi:hypothetical protein
MMEHTMRESDTKVEQDQAKLSAASSNDMTLSSPGDMPLSVTPKDVSPDEAAARDFTERKLNSDDLDEREEALLDEASDLSFPASDPISVPVYQHRQRAPSNAADVCEPKQRPPR